MRFTNRKRKKYTINTGNGKFLRVKEGRCWVQINYKEFSCIRAAMRYFKAHPQRLQIDVSDVGKRGYTRRYCLYYKVGRKIYKNV